MRFITSTNPILSPRGRYSTCCLMYSSPVQYEGCGLSAGLDVKICCVFCGCCCCLLFKCDRLQAPVSPKWQRMWCHMLQRYRYIDVTRVSGCTDFEVVVKSFQINPLDLSSLGDEVPAIPVGRADTGCAPVFVPLKCRPSPRSQISQSVPTSVEQATLWQPCSFTWPVPRHGRFFLCLHLIQRPRPLFLRKILTLVSLQICKSEINCNMTAVASRNG